MLRWRLLKSDETNHDPISGQRRNSDKNEVTSQLIHNRDSFDMLKVTISQITIGKKETPKHCTDKINCEQRSGHRRNSDNKEVTFRLSYAIHNRETFDFEKEQISHNTIIPGPKASMY